MYVASDVYMNIHIHTDIAKHLFFLSICFILSAVFKRKKSINLFLQIAKLSKRDCFSEAPRRHSDVTQAYQHRSFVRKFLTKPSGPLLYHPTANPINKISNSASIHTTPHITKSFPKSLILFQSPETSAKARHSAPRPKVRTASRAGCETPSRHHDPK